VLRYWEQEFTQLKPMKRRGNRRYYQHHEVLLIRRIRELLYDQGFTIIGARNRLGDAAARPASADVAVDDADFDEAMVTDAALVADSMARLPSAMLALDAAQLRAELMSIRELLSA
jgi:DNA-binding transcriptional MerR regulator